MFLEPNCIYNRQVDIKRKINNVTGLFVFEGPDGVGKTSTVNEVEKRLHVAGLDCVCLSFPGKEQGTIGAHIYKLHHELSRYDVTQISQLSLQLLHVAAHIDTIEQRILPMLSEGKTVLLDRYWWSTWAYGITANIPVPQLEAIITIEKLVWRSVIPTTLFLLSRQQSLASPQLANVYKDLVRQESDNYPVIAIKNEDTTESISEEVTRLILAASCTG